MRTLTAMLTTLTILLMSLVPAASANIAPPCPPEPGAWVTICSYSLTRTVTLYNVHEPTEHQTICITQNICEDVPRPLSMLTPYQETVTVPYFLVGVNAGQILSDVCGIIDPALCAFTTMAVRVAPDGAEILGVYAEGPAGAAFVDLATLG